MRWIQRLLLVALSLALLALGGLAGSALLSLDWDRAHTAQTAGLPLLRSGAGAAAADGLVRIEANSMTFRARVAGMGNDGPGIILLHGFPETSAMWSPLPKAAALAGFRVVAFDQRGYSPGARPEGVDAYAISELASDVIAIANSVGFERFHLVGHDWGCVVGWAVAIGQPERVTSWSALSIPHPGTLIAALRRELPSYIRLLTAPFVPETLLSFNSLAALRKGSYPGSTARQREEYLAVFSEPGALTGALNWYRAITASLEGAEAVAGPVQVPTLFLWGTGEGWVTDAALEQQRKLVNAAYAELELDAGHFLMQEKPAEAVAAVMEHIRRIDRSGDIDVRRSSGNAAWRDRFGRRPVPEELRDPVGDHSRLAAPGAGEDE